MAETFHMSGNIKTDPKLLELLETAKERYAAMTPTERAIDVLRAKVSYVTAEMTVNDADEVVRTREEAAAIVAKSDSALILAELDRRAAKLDELESRLSRPNRVSEEAVASIKQDASLNTALQYGFTESQWEKAKAIEYRIFGPYQWQDQGDRAACMFVAIMQVLKDHEEETGLRLDKDVVAWRCRDYAGEWAYFLDRDAAWRYRDETDCLIEGLRVAFRTGRGAEEPPR